MASAALIGFLKGPVVLIVRDAPFFSVLIENKMVLQA
jgi:hypothetical protein